MPDRLGPSYVSSPATCATGQTPASVTPANCGTEEISAHRAGRPRGVPAAITNRPTRLKRTTSGHYKKFTAIGSDLFRPHARRVSHDARGHPTRGGATPFDCLANLWSDQVGRQGHAPVCRAYYILGFFRPRSTAALLISCITSAPRCWCAGL